MTERGTTIQQHPGYHDGFYDAQCGTPIWDDQCTPEYRAGWDAYWNCRSLLASGEQLPQKSEDSK